MPEELPVIPFASQAEWERWLEENAAAVDITLSDRSLAELARAFPPDIAAGTRYPEPQMKRLGL